MISVLLACLYIRGQATSNTNFTVQTSNSNVTVGPSLCADSEASNIRFNPITFQCEACRGPNKLVVNGIDCVCDDTSIAVTDSDYHFIRDIVAPFVCVQCPAGKVPSKDKSFCVSPTLSCDGVLRDRTLQGAQLVDQVCLNCSTGYRPSNESGGICVPCPSPRMNYTDEVNGCDCQLGFRESGDGQCLEEDSIFGFNIEYTTGDVVVDSHLLLALLPSSYENCKKVYDSFSSTQDNSGVLMEQTNSTTANERNETACQALANLCVLSFYKTLADGPCEKYLELLGEPFVGSRNNIPEWPLENIPWLYYSQKEGRPLSSSPLRAVRADKERDVFMKGTYNGGRNGPEVGTMDFRVAIYDLYGRFLGIKSLSTEIQRCPVPVKERESWLDFSTSYEVECDLTVHDFAVGSEHDSVLFYEPYLVDRSLRNGIWEDVFYPVPVLLPDMVNENNQKINSDTDYGDLLFVRRFFLFDNVSSLTENENQESERIVRVASQVAVKVVLRNGDDGKIHPPVLSVQYNHVLSGSGGSDQTYEYTFKGLYSSNLNGLDNRLEAITAICVCLATTLAYIRNKSSRERNRIVQWDLYTIARFLQELSAVLSTLIFVVLCGVSLYFLIFSKGDQSGSAFVLPPKNEDIDLFETLLIVGTLFKALHFIFVIHQQSQADIFFIDWEPPKQPGSIDRVGEPEAATVSLWRRLFVANEWNELQTQLQFPMELVLLLMLFFWSLGADELPSENEYVSDAPDNKILRFGVAAMLFLPISAVLWIGSRMIYSRFFHDSLGQFEDLCSLCNISLIILTHSCYGYYIHGRSVHGIAQVSMAEMRRRLNNEASGQTGRRGLVPESDDQVFEIHVPWTLRDRWDDMLLVNVNSQGAARATQQADQTSKSYDSLNQFFMAFLSHNFVEDLDWTLKESKFLESLLGLIPIVNDRAVFYTDRVRKYSDTLLWGHQGTFLLAVFFIFAIIDWFSQNWGLSVFVAYAIYRALVAYKGKLSTDNICRKSLIDKAFLI
eukprot:m.75010 g.75010  ORF g.75010 m.75010 type:complete len:1006 (+) comp12487_c0_seq3:1381-4398(+)